MSEDSVTLGKRKRRNDGGQRPSGSTLFVSNLPYTATTTDLKTLFSDFAPVRSAFVVLEDNVSKGIGYVSFAIKEDAKSALETIENDGLELNGRKLRVQLADPKPRERTTEKKVKSERKTPTLHRVSHPKLPKDPNAIRTIVISGLPDSIDKKSLWKKVRKCEGAESVELVEGVPRAAHVLFSSPASAAHAVEKLHAHVFKGAILSVALKKRLENLAKVPAVEKEGMASSATPSRSSRLIVRNLPWDISENDLRALFLPFGPVYSINIPLVETSLEDSKIKNSKPRAKGFAFVWLFSKKDAERAIAAVNGRAVEAGSIVAPTMNKKERQRLRKQLRQQSKGGMAEDAESEGHSDSDDERDEGRGEKAPKAGGSGPRILAVDWALSKDKWEEVKEKVLGDQAEDASASEGEKDSNLDWASEESDEESEIAEDGSEDDSHGEEQSNERSDAEDAAKPILPQTDVGTTVFVRNVPFDATEDELRVLFRVFGPLRYARVTVDAETGRSRGTGFVCFWSKESADKVVQQSEILNRETGTGTPSITPNKKNPFSMPSLLTPDPSSAVAQPLVLHGRTLDVTRAVTRDEAARLKDEGERQREKEDKRSLYLLREGVIFPNSPAAATLGASELEKRQTSFNARRNLLKSNPSLYVSRTRLSIRQLPLFVTDRALKRLAIHAVRSFEEEVKRGEREPLSEEELRADTDTPGDGEGDGKVGMRKRKGKKGERETGVKQAKVVRQTDRIDALTGKGRSRGYGFLEMKRHTDALRVLRWANNNQTLYSLLDEWWRDEIEDLARISEQRKATTRSNNAPGQDDDVEARVRRLRDELERFKSEEGRKIGSKKTLIIEFSIENAQVVNRRKDKIESMKSASKRAPSSSVIGGIDDKDGDGEQELAESRTAKRRKWARGPVSKDSAKSAAISGSRNDRPARTGKDIGSIIGRKRKRRNAEGKGKS